MAGYKGLLSFLRIFLYFGIFTLKEGKGKNSSGKGEGKGGRWQEKALFPPRSLPDAKPNIRNSEEEEEDEEDRLPLSVLWGFFLARRG